MKIVHLNINGDFPYAELAEYDIICVSETKLNELVETSKLEINGFSEPISRDRQFNSAGGFFVFIKNNIEGKMLPKSDNE